MKDKIIEKVRDSFLKKTPNQSSIYIFYIIDTGMVLFDDVDIGNRMLIELINDGIVKKENGSYYHQGLKAIRYRFLSFSYPSEFYREIPKNLRLHTLNKYNNRCANCGTTRHLSIDHIIPWSLGGLTTKDNLQVLCKKCNSSKGNR